LRIPRQGDHSFPEADQGFHANAIKVSRGSRSRFPFEGDHDFHGKPIKVSTRRRSRFPRQADQTSDAWVFHGKSIGDSSDADRGFQIMSIAK
jgi:hypothetical protein